MTTTKKILSVTTISTLLCGGGLALAKMDKVDPSLPKEVQPMHSLVGEWKGNVRAQMGGQQVDGKVTISCKPTSVGYGILCQSRFTGLPGSGLHEETDLFGYDPSSNKYHWFVVSNDGETHDHVAEPPTPSADKTVGITWVYSGRMDGKPMQEIVKFSFSDDCTKLSFSNTTVVDGQQGFAMSGSVTKK